MRFICLKNIHADAFFVLKCPYGRKYKVQQNYKNLAKYTVMVENYEFLKLEFVLINERESNRKLLVKTYE